VLYIAFELLRGKSLGQSLADGGPLDPGAAARLGVDVLRALEAAHARGIIHRDIKPHNVFLLDEAPWTKVLDFGVAKAVTGLESNATQATETGQMVGTPQYMAPEQVRGNGIFPSSDLYSLGLVLAEALTGVRVVRDEAPIRVYLAHVSGEPLPIDRSVVDGPLGAVVLRATAKDPNARYGSASAMLADLEAVAPSLPDRPSSEVRTRPLQAFPDLVDDRATRPTRAHEDLTDRHRGRALPLRAGGTMVMEEVDDAPPSGAPPSFGAAVMAQLSSVSAAPASLTPTSQGGLAALSSSYAHGVPTPTSHGGLLQTAGAQGVHGGVWGAPPPHAFPPPSVDGASPLVPPLPIGHGQHSNALAPGAPPANARGLRVAVALVFALVLVVGGFGLWLALGG
jgi:serine/threonine protein kinase